MSQTLDKKLYAAIDELTDKQKKAMLSIMEAFAEKGEGGHWQNEAFVAEMDRRYNDYKSGKTKLISLDEVEKKARVAAQKISRTTGLETT